MKVSERKIKKQKVVTKEELETVPFFVVLFLFGLKSSTFFSEGFSWLAFAIALGCVLASLIRSLKPKTLLTFLSIASISSGIFYGIVGIERECNPELLKKFDNTAGKLSGRFVGEFKFTKAGGINFNISKANFALASETIELPGTIKCKVANCDVIPSPEQQYELYGKIHCGFNEGRITFSARDIKQVSPSISPFALAGKFRRKIRDGIFSLMSLRHATIMTGFLLGDTSLISQKDKELFRTTGISHLLAVSGQHIMVIVLLIASLTYWLGIPPISRSLIIIISLTGYALTTSGEPSILRAVVMYAVAVITLHIESSRSPIKPIAIAAFILLIFSPSIVNHIGFQLSFIAILSILLLRPPFEYYLCKIHLPTTLARYLSVSFAAGIGTMPMIAFLFGTVSLSALFVNPMVVWLFGFILPAGFLISGLASIAPAIGLFVAPALSIVLDGLLLFLGFVSSFSGLYIKIGSIPGLLCAFSYGAMLFMLATWHKAVYNKAVNIKDNKISLIESNKTNTLSSHQSHALKTVKATAPKAAVSSFIKESNHFTDKDFTEQLDVAIINLPRRSLKDTYNSNSITFPYTKLLIENQTTYFQLIDLEGEVLKESGRLTQAYVFALSILGTELLNKLSLLLNTQLTAEDFTISIKVKNKRLSFVILADHILNSRILPLASNENSLKILASANAIFKKGRKLLRESLKELPDQPIDELLNFRIEALSLSEKIILINKVNDGKQ